jgi:hypothetical protein
MSCFRLLEEGWCSFCGNDQFRVLLASPLREVAICDRCAVSGCDTLGELLAAWRGGNRGAHVPPPYYDSEFLARVEALVHGLEVEGARRTPSAPPDGCCSFCEATRQQAVYLVSGPQAFVCERCVASCCRVIARGPKPASLDEALIAAFPIVTIDRTMIDEPSALWDAYVQCDELALFEGRTWRDLPSNLLFRHSSLLSCAGDTLFRVVLPSYLRYLLHERHRFNDLAWQVAGQLTKRDDAASHPRFERRVAHFTDAQRTAIRDVLAHLATIAPIEEVMSRALPTWDHLQKL